MQRIYILNRYKAIFALIAACGLGLIALSAYATGAPASPWLIGAALPAGGLLWAYEHLKNKPDPEWTRRDRANGSADPVNPLEDNALRQFIWNGELNPTIKRIVEVTTGQLRGVVALVPDMVVLNKDRTVEEFSLRPATSGALTNDKLVENIQTAMAAVPVPSGSPTWKLRVDAKGDRLTFKGTSTVPKVAFPDKWHVVRSVKEAGTAFTKYQVILGRGEGNELVSIPIETFPQMVVISGTGGGKSVMIRNGIERARAYGAMMFLGDGKGSDYVAYTGAPNVVAVGRGTVTERGLEYFGVIEMVYRIMQSRADDAAFTKVSDPEHWMEQPAVFLIMDELKSMMKTWFAGNTLDKASRALIEARVNKILSLGREYRIHVVMATQDAYDASIKGSWLSNIGLRVVLKQPPPNDIRKTFVETLWARVAQVAAGFDTRVRGRGLVAGSDDETGASIVKEFQGFYGYAPGERYPTDPKAIKEWNDFKAQVTDQIPRLYSRMWYRLDQPSEKQRKYEEETGKPLGFIDFEMYTAQEITELDLVNLDMRDAEGNLVPDPQMVKFDPTPANDAYIGRRSRSSSNTKLPTSI